MSRGGNLKGIAAHFQQRLAKMGIEPPPEQPSGPRALERLLTVTSFSRRAQPAFIIEEEPPSLPSKKKEPPPPPPVEEEPPAPKKPPAAVPLVRRLTGLRSRGC